MRIHTMTMQLLRQFVPMEQKEFEDMSADAKEWYNAIQRPEDNSPEAWEAFYSQYPDKRKDEKKIKMKLMLEQWYIRAAVAIAYIVLYRWIKEYMQPKLNNQHDEDEH